MKKLILALALWLSAGTTFAQKPAIDSTTFGKWPSLGGAGLSNDGKYTWLIIENQPIGSKTLVVREIKGDWKKEFPRLSNYPEFIGRDKVMFQLSGDTLCILTLGTSITERIPNTSSFSIPFYQHDQWLAYQIKSAHKQLFLRNLITGKETRFVDINNYWFSMDGKILALNKDTDSIESESKIRASAKKLVWIDLANGKMQEILKGNDIDHVVFDQTGNQAVFSVKTEDSTSYWYYRSGNKNARFLADDQAPGIPENMQLGHLYRFSNDGKRLFFKLKDKAIPKPCADAVRLNVWSYFDERLQSEWLNELKNRSPKEYFSVMPLDTPKIIRIQDENDDCFPGIDLDYKSDAYFIVAASQGGDPFEGNWNIKTKKNRFLVSTYDGTRQSLPPIWETGISNEGKFVLYFDRKDGQYYTYEIASGKYRNISNKIPVPVYSVKNGEGELLPYGKPFWSDGDKAVIIYDQFDMWQVDPFGLNSPVCLTQQYGRKNNVELRKISENNGIEILNCKDKIFLVGLDPATKQNSYWEIIFNKKNTLSLLSKGEYLSFIPQRNTGYPGMQPLKAQNSSVYIVTRESASDCPNYFYTTDFKTFTKLTDLHPQKDYNWMTAELHTWKSLNGEALQGVLYKPENFDPNKKYPVIFYYYELMSDNLHMFREPAVSRGSMNIPWFVSNEYLVFTPDIHYRFGDPFQGTYDCVLSAAHYISNLPYVNAQKIGIQGHSFGGIQTNYLVTHTNLFAAACSANGTSDFISHFGALTHGERGGGMMFELGGQFRVGSTLWERPDWYINNSPVLKADKVKTPLLMIHTSVDGACPFPQAIEFFTGLRRLGKRVWMLEYQDGNHEISDYTAARDYSQRMSQFFDHYLKDKPAPLWMLDGIPATKKGVDNGLALDKTGRVPGPGLLSNEDQRRVDSLMSREPMTIILK